MRRIVEDSGKKLGKTGKTKNWHLPEQKMCDGKKFFQKFSEKFFFNFSKKIRHFWCIGVYTKYTITDAQILKSFKKSKLSILQAESHPQAPTTWAVSRETHGLRLELHDADRRGVPRGTMRKSRRRAETTRKDDRQHILCLICQSFRRDVSCEKNVKKFFFRVDR